MEELKPCPSLRRKPLKDNYVEELVKTLNLVCERLAEQVLLYGDEVFIMDDGIYIRRLAPLRDEARTEFLKLEWITEEENP